MNRMHRIGHFTPDEARLIASRIDQLVREHTAGKGYRANRRLCGSCHLPLTPKDPTALEHVDGRFVLYHTSCNGGGK